MNEIIDTSPFIYTPGYKLWRMQIHWSVLEQSPTWQQQNMIAAMNYGLRAQLDQLGQKKQQKGYCQPQKQRRVVRICHRAGKYNITINLRSTYLSRENLPTF